VSAPINRLFGDRVARARKEQGLSMRDLATKAGVSGSTASRVERGTETWLSVAARIAEALGVPLAELVAEPVCGACDGSPPRPFICPACGRGAP
jgi:transcriptional regulator with XRE-family HTH domain